MWKFVEALGFVSLFSLIVLALIAIWEYRHKPEERRPFGDGS